MSQLKTYLSSYPWSLRLELADWSIHGNSLKAIEANCFDEQMRSQAYDLEGLISDPAVTAMVLYKADTIIGYIAGAGLECESASFNPATDPKVGWGEFDTFYVDNVSILPEHRAPEHFAYMVMEYIRYCSLLGYTRTTTHARRSNGLSAYCIRKLKFKRLKTIKNWYDCGEDFDYLILTKDRANISEKSQLWHNTVDWVRKQFQNTWLERHFRAKQTN